MLDSVKEIRPHPLDRPREFDVFVAFNERFEEHSDFEAGERRPETEVGPPPPKETCGLGSRPMSKRSGSSKTAGSRFAEAYHRATMSPAETWCPAISRSSTALRRKYSTGDEYRTISSTAERMSSGCSRSRCHSSG